MLAVAALAGCGGGSDGAPGATGATGPAGPTGPSGPAGSNAVATVNAGSNATPATPAAAAAWQALAPQVTVQSVTINSAPVVKFTVKDAAGNPVVGLANYSQGSTATVKGLTNVAFTLAKLVPASTYTVTSGGVTTTYNSEPSKWVSYNVYKTPTVAQKAAAPTVPWYGTWPSTDAQGTLVDNGDGSYQYTFMRDPKQAAAIVAALPDTLPLSDKKDLGDVSYDPTLTHRLGIQIGGAAPGTGSNTPNAVTSTPGVNMVNTANIVYDFRPDGAPVTNTRDVVSIDTCGSCHDKKVLAHGSRKDPRYCVTCHTDQVKYSINAEATPVGSYYLTGTKTTNTSVVNGKSLADFPNMIHKVHMGNRLVKQGYNFIPNSTSGIGVQFNTLAIPQDIRNCTTCHDGAAAVAAKKTTNGDNWKNNPSVLACGSCHDGINFATGAGSTIADKLKDVAAKVAVGTTQTGHAAGQDATNPQCALCHTAEKIAVYHTGKLPTNSDATKRTMSAAISKATVAADGSVTVNFTLSDNGVAVTDPAAISGLAFSLAKLNPAVNGASTHWQSYTGKARTTVAANPPVVQGYNETALAANLTVDATTKVWTYKFQLLNAATPGDIRTIDHVHNLSTATGSSAITGQYSAASMPTLPYVVSYDPTLTHRIGIEFNKAATTTPVAAAVANKFNAIYDWVPDGNKTAQTRNIVSMDSCATCHAGSKIHKGFTTEYCVTCHNQNTYDPSSGTGNGVGSKLVDLQVIVHKLHMGNQLPSVKAGVPYTINGAAHDYSNVAYPGVIKNCAVCHKATATKADGKTLLENRAAWYTTPTKRACSTCHDSVIAVAHIDSNVSGGVETCVTCHAPGKVSDIQAAHGN
ncbi:MAG: OmcA/MtrC family decaheme c-type cytochrome [Rhodoferax sp.]|uniref:OmcA/MtrC family decaheme c-type cytochrome n=1 Tax=Rhodoferax sp. TaxID=50421 RepID=UPI0026079012|nr:OmcA/MtrC family decaheme c-type cytochrome [Rhodoferax sp.]MDD5335003.1 OmcA/MtrC family decaheme c-type cytochrome [Rhodoferax sp.]